MSQPTSVDRDRTSSGDVAWTFFDEDGRWDQQSTSVGFSEPDCFAPSTCRCQATCCRSGSVCCGSAASAENCLTSPHLLGDWLGVRPWLSQRGIVANLELTQFYQGTSSGGREQRDAYGGKLDYFFTIAGGLVVMHAETRFGESIAAREAGAFAFPNTNMLYPLPGEHVTSITGLLVNLPLSERVAVSAGKLNSLDFWTMVYPQVGRGVEGFMNLNALSAGLPWLRFVNLSENAAGILVSNDQKQIRGGFMVFDLNNSTTTSGISNLFDDGAGLLGVWRFFTDVGGLPGSHLFACGWSSRTYLSLDPLDWTNLPGVGGITPGGASEPWSLAYYFEQVFWTDPGNRNRKAQFWTGWSLSDGNPSFGRWGGFASIEGFGVLPSRSQDRLGIAYFYNQLSSDYKQLVGTLPTLELQNIHGGEVYYNFMITPSSRLTFDMQVVDNANVSDKVAIILGGRLHINL